MYTMIVPWGIFGSGNVGDEAMLQGFTQLSANAKVVVVANGQVQSKIVVPEFTYRAPGSPLPTDKINLIVGGTPITDQQGTWPLTEIVSLVSRYQPIALIGIGSEPLRVEESKKRVGFLAQHVFCWSVRSQHDLDRLCNLGVPQENITVAADLAWLRAPSSLEFGEKILGKGNYIGVNLTNEPWVVNRNPNLFSHIAKALDILVKKTGATVLLFANEIRNDNIFDSYAGLRIQKNMTCSDNVRVVSKQYYTPQQMCSLIAQCQVTVGMRYHFCLFSTMQGVPFLALKRQPKVGNICVDLEWQHHLDIEDISTDSVVQQITDIIENKEVLQQTLHTKTAIMKQRAQKNKIAIDLLIKKKYGQ